MPNLHSHRRGPSFSTSAAFPHFPYSSVLFFAARVACLSSCRGGDSDDSGPQLLPAPTATPLGSVSKDLAEARALVSSFRRPLVRSLHAQPRTRAQHSPAWTATRGHRLWNCETAARGRGVQDILWQPPWPIIAAFVTATSARSARHPETNRSNPRNPGPVAPTRLSRQNLTLVLRQPRRLALLPSPARPLSAAVGLVLELESSAPLRGAHDIISTARLAKLNPT